MLGALAVVGDGSLLRHRRAAHRQASARGVAACRRARVDGDLDARDPAARDRAGAASRSRGGRWWGRCLALGIPGTAFAYLLFFGLIAGAGAAYASLVTYLIPPIALAYGAIFLGERFGVTAFGGLALILGGVALGTGFFAPSRLRRRLASQT